MGRLMCHVGWHAVRPRLHRIARVLTVPHGVCRRCGFEGLIDSNGGLF